jgi:hypothetical protein
MYKYFVSTLIIIAIATIASAQGRVGSPYTRYGIGDINGNTLIRNNSMGGLSYTLPYNNGINFVNPAGTGKIDSLTFIFDFGLNGGFRSYSISNPETHQIRSDFQLSHLLFGFSITKWWKTSMGAMPFSNVGYTIVARDSSLNVSKDYLYAGNGGVNRVMWNNSFTPFKNFSLGINAYFLFGKMYQSNAIDFDDDSGAFLNIIEQNIIRVNDFTFDAGFNYTININSKNSISIAGVYGHNSQLYAERNTIVYNTLSTGSSAVTDTIYQSNQEEGKIGLPQKTGFGLGYNYDNKFFIGADYSIQNWSGAQYFGTIDNLSNGTFLSVGTEYTPAGRGGNAYKYWQGVSYRAGFHVNETYFELASGETPISDFGISFGLGLPMKRSKTSFNLSLQLGQRGSLENNLIKENYAIFGLSFNLAEMWFVKSKFD